MQNYFQTFPEIFHTTPLSMQINFIIYIISVVITTYILLFHCFCIQDNIAACEKTKGGRYIGIPLLILIMPISCFLLAICFSLSLMVAIATYYLISFLYFLWGHGLEKILQIFFTWYNSPIKKENKTNT